MQVHSVTDGSVLLSQSRPPAILLTAHGMVTTSGWSNPRLEAVVHTVPPADGIQEVDFQADPPQGITLQVLTPVSAKASFGPSDPADYWGPGQRLEGFRIRTASNLAVVLVDGIGNRE